MPDPPPDPPAPCPTPCRTPRLPPVAPTGGHRATANWPHAPRTVSSPPRASRRPRRPRRRPPSRTSQLARPLPRLGKRPLRPGGRHGSPPGARAGWRGPSTPGPGVQTTPPPRAQAPGTRRDAAEPCLSLRRHVASGGPRCEGVVRPPAPGQTSGPISPHYIPSDPTWGSFVQTHVQVYRNF